MIIISNIDFLEAFTFSSYPAFSFLPVTSALILSPCRHPHVNFRNMFLLLGHRGHNICVPCKIHIHPAPQLKVNLRVPPSAYWANPHAFETISVLLMTPGKGLLRSLTYLLLKASLQLLPPILGINKVGNRSDVRKLLFILYIPTCKLHTNHTKNFPSKMIAHVIPHQLVHLTKCFDNCHLGHLCVRS